MRTKENIEAAGRDYCRLRSTLTLTMSFNDLEAMIWQGGLNAKELDCALISRGWIFEELDRRGRLGDVGICNGCYSDVKRGEPCECDEIAALTSARRV